MSSIRHYRKAEFILYNSKSESSISYTINFPKMKDFFQNNVTATGTNLYLLFLFFKRHANLENIYSVNRGTFKKVSSLRNTFFFCLFVCLFCFYLFD